MDAQIRQRVSEVWLSVYRHKQANLILTFIVAFISLYIGLIAVFHRNIIHPLELQNATYFYETDPLYFDPYPLEDIGPIAPAEQLNIPVNEGEVVQEIVQEADAAANEAEEAVADVVEAVEAGEDVVDAIADAVNPEPTTTVAPYHWMLMRRLSQEEDYILTTISLFLLWGCALALGKIASLLYLPPLLGMLIVGIIFGNVSAFRDTLVINRYWEETVRQLAFIIIMIRSGLSLDPDMLKTSIYTCAMLGFVTTTVEVIVVTLSAHFFFGVPVAIAIAFGYVLAATSPAVTVPTMIRLQKEERGTDKGIPTVVLASTNIDNLYCITAFYIVIATTLNANGQLSYTIPRILVEALIAGILGILAGVMLRVLPRKDASWLHFSRGAMVLSLALGLYYGTRGIRCVIAGPVIVFLMCIVAAMKWKYDNPKRTKPEERGFRIIWVLIFQPLLFALIGLFFDFSVLTWELFGDAMAILVLAVFFRVVSAFAVSLCATSLTVQEQAFMSIAFCPKATVQAALAPALAVYCARNLDYQSHANLVLQTCILSILITAPLGQLLIMGLGRVLLFKRNVVSDYNISNIGSNVSTYLQPLPPKANGGSKPNTLEIEITPAPPATDTTPIPPPMSFKEINQQAYRIFKEQHSTVPAGNTRITVGEYNVSGTPTIENRQIKF
uniref:Na_H_Exchanger domain-containing protein n=1 Tax=Panagrellus redivivus TaxID=6233 RepID=A0A7E4V8L5_PANRE